MPDSTSIAPAFAETDRRSFLAAGAALTAVAAMPIFTSARHKWAMAMARFETARAAELKYQKDFYTPADDDWVQHDLTIPPAILTEMDRLTEITDVARLALIDTPAPDRAALRWKLHEVLKGDGAATFANVGPRRLDQLFADIACHLGDA